MGHLWQRFLLACALLVGLAVGVAATVFGYSNLATVDVHWSVFHLNGIPLWTVAVVPVTLILVAGTVYHWIDGLHHFTEHMRHRHRVRELESEITRLREHLDHVLEMPRGDRTQAPAIAESVEEVARPSLPAAAPELESEADEAMSGLEAEPAPAQADAPEPEEDKKKASSDRKKRSRFIIGTQPEPVPANGVESEPVASTSKEG